MELSGTHTAVSLVRARAPARASVNNNSTNTNTNHSRSHNPNNMGTEPRCFHPARQGQANVDIIAHVVRHQRSEHLVANVIVGRDILEGHGLGRSEKPLHVRIQVKHSVAVNPDAFPDRVTPLQPATIEQPHAKL
jgi:hypothetical protein